MMNSKKKVKYSNIWFCTLLLLVACKGSKADMQTVAIDELIITRLGEGAEVQKNSDSTLILALKADKRVPSNPRTKTDYVVIKSETGKVVHEGSFEAGYIKWIDNSNLEMFSPPGMIRSDQDKNDLIKIINVNTKKVISKSKFLESEMK